MLLNGLEVIHSCVIVDRIPIQSKTHRQKRINKKWLKKYGTKIIEVPKKDVFIFDGKIIGHPKTLNKLTEKMLKEALIW